MGVTLKKIITHGFYLLLPLGSICLIILLLAFPNQSLDAASGALSLCFTSIIPTLFPFFVLENIIFTTGFPSLIGHFTERLMKPIFNLPGNTILPLILGLTAGYPSGAKMTVALYENNMITKSQAQRLLGFTNNAGPLFIVGAVAVGMLGLPQVGIPLLITHMISALLVGIITGFLSRFSNSSLIIKPTKKPSALSLARDVSLKVQNNPGKLIADSLLNALQSTLLICGFIVFFSVLTQMFLLVIITPYINNPLVSSVITGLIEITNGNALVAGAPIALKTKLILISFILGTGGLSVYMQVAAICSNSRLSLTPYIKGKLLQGIIAAAITYFIL